MEPHQLSIAHFSTSCMSLGHAGLNEQQVVHNRMHYSLHAHTSADISFAVILLHTFAKVRISFVCTLILALYNLSSYTFLAYIFTAVLFLQSFFAALYNYWSTIMTNKALELIAYHYPVIRNGIVVEVDQLDLVVGDIFALKVGQKIPLNARLIESHDLIMNEEAIIGSSIGIEKQAAIIEDENSGLDSRSILYKDSYVVSGWGIATILMPEERLAEKKHYKQNLQGLSFKSHYHQESNVLLFCMFLIGSAVGCVVPTLIYEILALYIGGVLVMISSNSIGPVNLLLSFWLLKMSTQQNFIAKKKGTLELLKACSVLIVDDTIDCTAALVEKARGNGIQIIMMSSKNKQDVYKKAYEWGIAQEEDNGLDGSLLKEFSDQDLVRNLNATTIYFSINNNQKRRLISLWRKLAKVVAVYGQSYEDMDVLVSADIVICNNTANNRVKELSNLIVLDNSCKTVLKAFNKGRYFITSIEYIKKYYLCFACAVIILFVYGIYNYQVTLFSIASFIGLSCILQTMLAPLLLTLVIT